MSRFKRVLSFILTMVMLIGMVPQLGITVDADTDLVPMVTDGGNRVDMKLLRLRTFTINLAGGEYHYTNFGEPDFQASEENLGIPDGHTGKIVVRMYKPGNNMSTNIWKDYLGVVYIDGRIATTVTDSIDKIFITIFNSLYKKGNTLQAYNLYGGDIQAYITTGVMKFDPDNISPGKGGRFDMTSMTSSETYTMDCKWLGDNDSGIARKVTLHPGPEGNGAEPVTIGIYDKPSEDYVGRLPTNVDVLHKFYGFYPEGGEDDQRIFLGWTENYNEANHHTTTLYGYSNAEFAGDDGTDLYAIWGYPIMFDTDGATIRDAAGSLYGDGTDEYLTYVADYAEWKLDGTTDPASMYKYVMPDLNGYTVEKNGARRVNNEDGIAYALMRKDGKTFFTWEGIEENLTIPPKGGAHYPSGNVNNEEWSSFRQTDADDLNNPYGIRFPELVAIWEPSVTYHANGGEGEDMPVDYLTWNGKKLYSYEDYMVLGCRYTKDGAKFTGWNTKADGTGTSVPAGTIINTLTSSEPIHYYAQWSDNSFTAASEWTLTLDADGGVFDGGATTQIYGATVDKTYGEIIGELPTPQRDGYFFEGWWTEEDSVFYEQSEYYVYLQNPGRGMFIDLTQKYAAPRNVTFYAKWIKYPEVTVGYGSSGRKMLTMDPNGGTLLSPSVYYGKQGDYYYKIFGGNYAPVVYRVGYTFDGWYDTTYGYYLRPHLQGEYLGVSGNSTWKAEWVPINPHECSRFETTRKETPATCEKTGSREIGCICGKVYTITLPTIEHKYETPWGVDAWPTCTTNRMDTYKCNTCDLTVIKEAKETALGHDWSEPYDNGAGYTVTECSRQHLYNCEPSSKPNRYNIIYTLNTEDAVFENYPHYHTYDTETVLVEPEKSGLTFAGWYYDRDFTKPVSHNGDAYVLGAKEHLAPIKLYAKWLGADYTLTLNAMGGTIDSEETKTVIHTFGVDTHLPVPVREGYEFKGWTTDSTGVGETEYTDKYPATKDEGAELYAKWEAQIIKVEYYDYETRKPVKADTYDVPGLDDIKLTNYADLLKEYEYCGTATLVNPTRGTKVTFDGFTNELGETVTAIDTTVYPEGGVLRLYLHWNYKTQFTVVLNVNGGTWSKNGETPTTAQATVTVVYGKETDLSGVFDTIAKPGYTFAGWNTAAAGTGTNYDNMFTLPANTVITKNATPLYAKWVPREFIVEFYIDGVLLTKDNEDELGVDYDTIVTEKTTKYVYGTQTNLVKPVKAGYTLGDATYYWHFKSGKTVWVSNGTCYIYKTACTEADTELVELRSDGKYYIPLYATFKPTSFKLTLNMGLPAGTNYVKADGTAVTPAANLTLAINNYTCDKEYDFSTLFSNLNSPGYRFVGWYKTQATTGVKYSDDMYSLPADTVTAAATIYAMWEPIEYDIEYYVNGVLLDSAETAERMHISNYDSIASVKTYTFATASTIIYIPTMTGYTITDGVWKYMDGGKAYVSKSVHYIRDDDTTAALITKRSMQREDGTWVIPLYVTATPTTFNVTLNSGSGTYTLLNDTTSTANQTVTGHTPYEELDLSKAFKDLNRPGHEFAGWKDGVTDEVYPDLYSIPEGKLNKIVTLTAQWQAIEFKIEYYVDGVLIDSAETAERMHITNYASWPSTYTFGTSYIRVYLPARTGYTVDSSRWFYKDDQQVVYIGGDTKQHRIRSNEITVDTIATRAELRSNGEWVIPVYATTTATLFNVTLVPSSGTFTLVNDTISTKNQTVSGLTPYELLDLSKTFTALDRPGYRFVYWAVGDKDGDVISRDLYTIPSGKLSQAVTLVAVWSPIVFNIEYYLDGIKLTDTYAEQIGVDYSVFTEDKETYKYGTDSYKLPVLTRTGYTVNQWYFKDDTAQGTTVTTLDKDNNMSTTNYPKHAELRSDGKYYLPLYATSTANTFTVTLVSNSGTFALTTGTNSTANVKINNCVSFEALDLSKTFTSLTRPGYRFAYWAVGEISGPEISRNVFGIPGEELTGAVTLHAIWSPIVFNIEYYLDGVRLTEENAEQIGVDYSVFTEDKETYKYGTDSYKLPVLTRTGYTVNQWYFKDDTAQGTKVTTLDKDNNMSTANYPKHAELRSDGKYYLSLYATSVPTKITNRLYPNSGTYTLPNGNTSTSNLSYTFTRGTATDLSTLFTNLERTGYTFREWNTAAAGTGTKISDEMFAFPADAPVTNVYIYAVWDANIIPIEYYVDGVKLTLDNADKLGITNAADVLAEGKTQFVYAGTAVIPVAAQKAGYSVTAWTYEDGTAIAKTGIPNTKYSYHNNGEGFVIKLHATTTATPYTVTLDANGGDMALVDGKTNVITDLVYDRSYDLGTVIASLTKPGYSFAGWLDSVSGNVYEDMYLIPAKSITGNCTLTAQWAGDSFSIEYYIDGALYAEGTHSFGTETTLLVPDMPGYTVSAWTYEDGSEAGETISADSFSYAEDGKDFVIRLFAVSTADSFKVHFDPNGGTMALNGIGMDTASADYRCDKALDLRSVFTDIKKAGHRFAGWSTAADGTGELITTDMLLIPANALAEETTLYAVWTVDRFAVEYYIDGTLLTADSAAELGIDNYEAVLSVAYHTYGSSTPVVKAKSVGFAVTDWAYADGSVLVDSRIAATAFTSAEKGTDYVIKLYAEKTTENYTVKFFPNGGTMTTADEKIIVDGYVFTHHTYTEDTNLEELFTSLVRDGYTFKEWNTKPDGSGLSASSDMFTLPANSVYESGSLYAIWTPDAIPVEYYIDGELLTAEKAAQLGIANYAELSEISFHYVGSVTVIPSADRTGYSMSQWMLDENTTLVNGVISADRYSFAKNGEDFVIRLNAKTLSADSLKVKLESNGGTMKVGEETKSFVEFTHIYDTASAFADNYTELSRKGYTLLGWSTDAYATEAEYTDTLDGKAITDDTILYAVWQADTYTINYFIDNQPLNADTAETLQILNYFDSEDPEDTTVYISDIAEYSFDGILTLVKPYHGGYGTLDWYYDGGTSAVAAITPESVVITDGAINLYATTEGKTALTYNVRLYPNGGTMELDASKDYKTVTHTYGTPSELVVPTRTGYTFLGWGLDPNDTDVVYTEGQTIGAADIVENTHLYAIWQAHSFDIAYYIKGADEAEYQLISDAAERFGITNSADILGTVKHTYGIATTLTAVTAPYYTATDWYFDEALTQPVYDNIIRYDYNGEAQINVYAVVTPNSYEVQLNANGGTVTVADGEGTKDVEYTAVVHTYGTETTLPTPVREGYTFNGWKENAENGLSFNTSIGGTDLTRSVVLHAEWIADGFKINYFIKGEGDTEYQPVSGAFGINNADKFLDNVHYYGTDTHLTVIDTLNYTVDGWYYDAENTLPVYDNIILADKYKHADFGEAEKEINVYAVLSPKTYEVRLYPNGGSVYTVPTEGETAVEKTGAEFIGFKHTYGNDTDLADYVGDKTRAGYKFLGWSADVNAVTPDERFADGIINGSDVDNYIYLYAVWGEPDTFGIEYYIKDCTEGAEYVQITPDSVDLKNKYSITNISEATGTNTHTYGTATMIVDLEAKGYDFSRWNFGDGSAVFEGVIPGNAYTEAANPGHIIKLYAVAIPIDYTVRLYPNGGEMTLLDESGAVTETVISGNAHHIFTHTYGKDTVLTSIATNPTKDGYIFAGWSRGEKSYVAEYVPDENGVCVLPADAVIADMTLYAVWTRFDSFDIEYYINGTKVDAESFEALKELYDIDNLSEATAETDHNYGEETQLTKPVSDYYTFTNWTYEDGTVDMDMIIHADDFAYQYDEEGNLTNKVIKLYTTVAPENYDVRLYPNGGTIKYTEGEGETATEITVDGSNFVPLTKDYDKSLDLTSYALTRDGYTFLGWSADAYAVTAAYTDVIAAKAIDEDVYLYAIWQANTYDIVYHIGEEGVDYGITNDVASVTVHTHGSLTQLVMPKSANYKFSDWSYADGTTILDGVIRDSKMVIGEDGKIHVYITAEAVKYNVRLYPNGGTMTFNGATVEGADFAAVESMPGEALDLSVIEGPTRVDYVFLGWSKSANATEALFKAGEAISGSDITDHTYLYAVWAPVSYDIKYFIDGVELTADTAAELGVTNYDALAKSHVFGDNTKIEKANVTGKTVSFWTDHNGNLLKEGRLWADRYYTTEGWDNVIKLSATTEAVTTDVRLYPNGGTLETDEGKSYKSVVHTYGTETALTDVPARAGYDFAGWNTRADGSGLSYTAIGADIDADVIYLYAQWTAKKYTVEYYLDGEVLNAEVAETLGVTNFTKLDFEHTVGEATLLPDLKRNYYNVSKWYFNNDPTSNVISEITADYMPEGDVIKLYAFSGTNTLTVRYFDTDGNVISHSDIQSWFGDHTESAQYPAKLTLPTSYNRSGYYFFGLYSEIECINPVTVLDTADYLLSGNYTVDVYLKAKPVDNTKPTGTIDLGVKNAGVSDKFVNIDEIVYGIYAYEYKNVTITGVDDASDVTVEYFLSEVALTKDEVKENTDWTVAPNGEPFILENTPDGEYIIYVKLTDEQGNFRYISSQRFVLDTVAPEFITLEDGEYCFNNGLDGYEFTVEDKYLDKFIVNDTVIDHTALTDGKYVLVGGEEGIDYTVYAKDKAGNEHTVTVKVYNTHDYESTVTLEPTCVAEGVMTYVCKRCGHTYTEAIPATGHTLVQVAAQQPTCTEIGWNAYEYCTVCEYTTYEEIPATDHDWDEGRVTTESTCVTEGVKTYTCLNDASHTYTEAVSATGHTEGSIVIENNVAPKCEEDGSYDEVVYCTVCSAQLSRESHTVDKLQHDWGETTYTWSEDKSTCTATRVCKNDNTHVESETVNTVRDYVAPMCIVPGHDNYTATFTVEWAETQEDPNPLPIDPEAHIPSGIIGIPLENTRVLPTCTVDGSVVVYDLCGLCYQPYNLRDEVLTALGHEWKPTEYVWSENYTVCTATRTCNRDSSHVENSVEKNIDVATVDPTCEVDGSVTYTAKFESDGLDWTNVNSKVTSIPASGHVYDRTVENVISNATCTEDGDRIDYYYCKVCGEIYDTVEVKIPALNHDWQDHEMITAPTCTTPGMMLQVCGRDETHTNEKELPIDPNSHDWDDGVIDPVPGCTSEGTITYTCKHNSAHTYTEVINATGHTPETITATAPTCTEPGLTEGTRCSVCKAIITAQTVVDALGHEYEGVVTDPTCTEMGYTTYTCTRCNDSYIGDYTAAAGHSFGQWTEVTAPTCTDMGQDKRECGVCGHTEFRDTEAKGHTLTEVEAKAPTCNAIGWNAYEYCTVCDYTTYVELPATGHTGGESKEVSRTEATCENEGEVIYEIRCINCNEVVGHESKILDKLGHNYVLMKHMDATCTVNGYDYYECTNDSSHNYFVILNAIGHTAGDKVVENNVAPTCTKEGSYEDVVYCTVCSAELSRTKVTVKALGHTEGEYVVEKHEDATCTANGVHIEAMYCTVCNEKLDETVQILVKTGHDMQAEELFREPTAYAAGELRSYCSRNCGHYTAREFSVVNTNGAYSYEKVADALADGAITTADLYANVHDATLSEAVTEGEYLTLLSAVIEEDSVDVTVALTIELNAMAWTVKKNLTAQTSNVIDTSEGNEARLVPANKDVVITLNPENTEYPVFDDGEGSYGYCFIENYIKMQQQLSATSMQEGKLKLTFRPIVTVVDENGKTLSQESTALTKNYFTDGALDEKIKIGVIFTVTDKDGNTSEELKWLCTDDLVKVVYGNNRAFEVTLDVSAYASYTIKSVMISDTGVMREGAVIEGDVTVTA